jgi:hypothetical protein
MEDLFRTESVTLRPALLALALGAATLLLVIRGAANRRPTALAAPGRRPAGRSTALTRLEAVYLRGDITPHDYVLLSRRLRGR